MINYLKVIELSLGVLILGILIQAIIWRLKKIKKELMILVSIFFAMPPLLFFSFNNFILSTISDAELPLIIALTYSLSLAYIQTYPALKEDIPSVKILTLIKSSEKLTKKELIKSHLLNSSLINVKQKELINDGFVYKHNKKIKLTRLGFLLAKIFIFYRNMLNLNDATG